MEMFSCCTRLWHDGGYESPGEEVEDKDAIGLSHVGNAAYNVLRTHHSRYHNTCWNVTSGKVIGEVHQTPRDGWLRKKEYPNQGHSDWFPEKMGEIMSRTEVWCDVMSLSPPDGLFLTKIQDALVVIAKRAEGKDKPVTIRMMFGNIIGMPVNATKVIKKLTEKLPPNANIRLWVGAWRRGASWNHAKIIAVDGKYLHTGGHNMWDAHYLKHSPVHDLSLELQGRVAHDGHRFANEQWEFIEYKQDTFCGQFVDKLPDNMPLAAKTRVVVSEYPSHVASEFPPKYHKSLMQNSEHTPGSVPIIAMGRLGTILPFARPSDDAIVAMLESSKTIVRMALQDLGPVCIPGSKLPLPGCKWPKRYLSVLARVLWRKGVDVEIALSNPASVPGGLKPLEACYGNGWTCVDVAAEIIKSIRKQFPEANDADLRKKVEGNLRVCFIREARGNKYADGMVMGQHAKHFIVDDVCTYIGSQNLYICDLAEWGVVIDNKESTKKIMKEYWEPMWKVSYKKDDCDVQEVMDGLNIDRDGEQESMFAAMNHGKCDMGKAGRLQTHAHFNPEYNDEIDDESA